MSIIMVSLGVISMAICKLISNYDVKSFLHVSFLEFGNKLEELCGGIVFASAPKI